MKRICTICARGGSKGVPGKNVRLLGGIPLIAHTLQQAQQSKIFDAIAVSSDSEEILQVALKFGADFVVNRPPELSTDTAPKIPATRHCVIEVENKLGVKFDTVVDLDATAPLRSVEDIIESTRLLEESHAINVLTVMKSRKSPYFNMAEENERGFAILSKKTEKAITRRQDVPICYDLNASIYPWVRDELFKNDSVFTAKTKMYIMPEERSIDIDTDVDFKWVEFLLEQRKL